MIKTKAPGKAILFGEHAVVYGITGIAASLNKHTTCTIKKSDKLILNNTKTGKKEINTEDVMNIRKKLDEYIDSKQYEKITQLKEKMNPYLSCPMYAIGLISDYTGLEPMEIIGQSDLRKGMGGSSSWFAALITALSLFYDLNLSKKEINDLAYQADKVAHAGTPSGIDNNTVVYGGYVSYNKEKGPQPLKIKEELPIVIGDTGKKANTGEMVAMVRKLRERNEKVKKAIEDVEKITQEAIKEINNHNLKRLGDLMNKNQQKLKTMNVSTPKLNKLIKSSLDAGAHGAKLSGAGGGGIMIALAENQEEVAEAIQNNGGEPIITTLGVGGVRTI